MTPPRCAKLVLLVLAVAIVGLGVWAWEPVYWWVTTERVEISFEFEGHAVKGWLRTKRFGGGSVQNVASFPELPPDAILHGRYGAFYTENGYRCVEGWWEHGEPRRVTCWHFHGGVKMQWVKNNETHRGPPWLWGVTDQTSPSMPEWMKDDAKWQVALDAQK